ncbi:hypothetical protein [Schlesneria paludicola]|uniref:hypothetical protein n=1 Tax=Schlesneria paludicola TaxID=360056 RepID=UPI00029ADC99|nr:hypothetical protein [Schlesneria paludicola]
MSLLRDLWNDESGLIMSAETVTLGTVGVLGAVVGMNAAGTAVNDELKEMSGAIRSLDQSYGYAGQRSCHAWTAGSCYIQPDVRQSLTDIYGEEPTDLRSLQQRVRDDNKAVIQPNADKPAPLPNDLPRNEKKASEATTVPPKSK